MTSKLCIHGHFYQPPRFDPWLEEVLPEPSAAPFHDWNQRINRECYAPLAFARRMDSEGKIFNIMNCYEYMSFNYGPTILKWMETHSPETYQKVIEGDSKSVDRLGKGNAMAQIYHHIIMPLSTEHDRDIEVNWSIIDFEHRYGRKPEGMWLAETAVCLDTLECLAKFDIKFTILAPRQARAIARLNSNTWTEVNENSISPDRPYLVRLASGREITVFFYDGPLSQAVAFERLLQDGTHFWQRIIGQSHTPFISLATDGESYGHHFKFGEMALAYVLEQALSESTPVKLTNYAAYLDEHPPEYEVRIWEKSSWSCVHGVERWREDCGCKDGGHPDWNQMWRKPLRRALNFLKYYIDEHSRKLGKTFFQEDFKALMDYGYCLCHAWDAETFLEKHARKGLADSQKIQAMKLIEMQRVSLASFASCAWFFDDISRIEPLNALSYALRGLDMLHELEGPDVEEGFLEILEEAYSNEKKFGDGRKIWKDLVLPRRVSPARMAVMAHSLDIIAEDIHFPGVSFRLDTTDDQADIQCTWSKTGEQSNVRLQVQESGQGTACPVFISEDNKEHSIDFLEKRLKNHVLWDFERKEEHKAWSRSVDGSAFIEKCLSIDFEEGQSAPIAGTGSLSLSVVFRYLTSEKECLDFEAYWTNVFKYNPFFRSILAAKVSEQLKILTNGEQPRWKEAAALAARSRGLEVYPDLFEVQNRLWQYGLEGVSPEIMDHFSFKRPT